MSNHRINSYRSKLWMVKQVALGGKPQNGFRFSAAGYAKCIGSLVEPYNCRTALTMVVNPNGAGDVTATMTLCLPGHLVSGASPSTSQTVGDKLKISINNEVAQEITLTNDDTNLTTGINIAANIQRLVRALTAADAANAVAYSEFTCDYTSSLYNLRTGPDAGTTGIRGSGCSIVVTPGSSADAAVALKLTAATKGASSHNGSGYAALDNAVTAAEAVSILNHITTGFGAGAALIIAYVGQDGNVCLRTATGGATRSLVINAASTGDTVFGLTLDGIGRASLGLARTLANSEKVVILPVIHDKLIAAAAGLQITEITTDGFVLYCEDVDSAALVDIAIISG